ncbi:CdaR family transcriptional regulator [Actinoplanes sp. OR16]|uniref:PucR family transcriptional regulator n=1 Tax=Actinoplanes sp. OR16 TaxID=946334 RepID=UPI000FDC164E|nr:PucR family transcriptional regulator [Actinoplanes sp. OR16]
MVQNAAWPSIPPRIADLFRQGAEAALDPPADWIEGLHAASLSGERMRPVAEDPVLVAGVRRSNVANLGQWTAANVRHPGVRVPVDLAPELLDTARDLVRRGLDQRALDSYRTGQSVAWRRWMDICFGLGASPDELRALLDISSLSISTFVEDTIAAVSERMERERAELTRGAHAERRATVTLILEGAPISRARAEAQLGYRLTGPHTAAIIWSSDASGQLEAASEALVRAGTAASRLTIVAGAAVLWLWLPVAVAPDPRDLDLPPGVRIAIGRPAADLDGFRRSHLDAVATQRMLTRLTSPQQVARYTDVQLVALLTADPAQADEFLDDTLGDLLHADAETRETVAVYVREQCSATRTAEKLFTHRNTVVRRLARADTLLPRPLAGTTLSVAAALEVLRWRG